MLLEMDAAQPKKTRHALLRATSLFCQERSFAAERDKLVKHTTQKPLG